MCIASDFPLHFHFFQVELGQTPGQTLGLF